MGKLQLWKIWHLLTIILKIYVARFQGYDMLYYPPSGPNSAVYRDMLILCPTRWMFKKTIFHFHASGLSTHYEKHGGLFQLLFRIAFYKPDLAIHLSPSCPQEGTFLHACKCVNIPNGLPDIAKTTNRVCDKACLNLLFVGLLEESKGEKDVLLAMKLAKDKGRAFHLNIAGEFKSKEYYNDFLNYINNLGLKDEVTYCGIIKGEEKDAIFRQSDIFVFPSFFHSESFPLVLIEAMEYGMPIIASNWRGITDMIEDGKNGFLVEIHSPHQISEKLIALYDNKSLRQQMSNEGRKLFENKYSMQQHLRLLENAINNI